MKINDGTLNVKGDYCLQSATGGYSTGILQMTGFLDKVIVEGDFLTDSSVNHTGYLTSGIMDIKGNFTQKSSYYTTGRYYNFAASSMHKVLLSGTGLQTVSFKDYTKSRFSTLVITKPLDIGYTFNYQPVWNTLMEVSDDTEAPTAPSNLTVTSKTSSSVSLSWTRSTDDIAVEKYVIFRDGIEVGETADASFTDTGLTQNTTYTYEVQAFDYNDNASDLSTSVTVITEEGAENPGKPDWYYVRTTDLDGNLLELYLSDIGGSVGESDSDITVIAKGSGSSLWKEYVLSGGTWDDTGITYASAPGGGVVTTAISGLRENRMAAASVSTMELPTIFNIDLEAKKEEILNKIYDKIGIDPRELTSEDVKMLALGVAYSIDDNVTFGIVQWLHDNTTGIEPPEDNYYYMRAKAYTDAMFVSIYLKTTLGSAAAALSALESAGLSGEMALATSPTGAGTAVFGTAALTELAGSVVMAGVSYASEKMAERSQNIFRSSMEKLQDIARWKLFKNIRAKNVMVKSAEEANDWWRVVMGYDDPPYKPGSEVFEFELIDDTMFVRVYDDINSPMKGQWFMKAEDIAGLTPQQIQNKFSLPTTPKYVVDLKLEAGTIIRGGEANSLYGFTGEGIQFDLMGQLVEGWMNSRLLP